jgi:hypothetical protein
MGVEEFPNEAFEKERDMSRTIERATHTGPTGWALRRLRSVALPLGLAAVAGAGCVDEMVGDDVDIVGGIAPGETEIGEDGVEVSTGALTGSITSSNPFGRATVISTDATNGIDRNNPFFKSLGTNGRTCESCHKLDNTLGVSTAKINSLFNSSQGLDPIFRINDGSNAPTGFFAKIGTVEERKVSFSMLLRHGVIRVGLPVPSSRDFNLVAVQDPYFFASAKELSLFRRPLPSVNMAFGSHVMWDGRESEQGRTRVRDALLNQANDATVGHAEAAQPITAAQRAAIADFQLKLFAAQTSSNIVGSLSVKACDVSPETGEPCEPARGGPRALVKLLTEGSPGSEEQGEFPKFAIGINDSFAPGFKNISFVPFEPWESENLDEDDDSTINRTRGDIGDGENIFYTKPIRITGVAGLNDAMGKSVVNGFCTTCHNNPDVGNHSRPRFFNIGIANAQGNPLFTSEYPLYTFRRNSDSKQITVTDPGLALRTGKFNDIGRFKVPTLRGLGARAPYFHNGMARTLTDVVKFYNQRFQIGFTDEEIRKVVLFLQQT